MNYTCSNLAEHLEKVSHDSVTDFLQNQKFTPKELWELVKERIDEGEEAFLVNDTVQRLDILHKPEKHWQRGVSLKK